MMRILFIFGTRPEAIKLSPLILRLKKNSRFKVGVCVTAQHREMLDSVLSFFEIQPDFDLDIMKTNQDLTTVSSRVIKKLDKVYKDFKPDLNIVHGDTITTSMASISSFLNKIKIAHVEAGLRTDNLLSPWPEEANRRITSVLADFNFCPTSESKQNLLKENISDDKIFITGNTVIDSLFQTVDKFNSDNNIDQNYMQYFSFLDFSKKIILVTGHRRENFGEGFSNICEAIKKLAIDKPEIQIVYPVHLNPNVQEPVKKILNNVENIFLIEPLDYAPFVYLMSKSYFILTDSGGIQEEAPSLGKPVLVMRENTERPEAVKAGTVKLVGTNIQDIYKGSCQLLNNFETYKKMSESHNPYGAGDSSEKIEKILNRFYE